MNKSASKLPATTSFKLPVVGNYAQSAVFLHEIQLDTRAIAHLRFWRDFTSVLSFNSCLLLSAVVL
jgi:hypothetical protein